jgi:hypothetical protein
MFQPGSIVRCVLTFLLGLLAAPLGAAQVSGQFNVTVTLQSGSSPTPTLPQSAFCTTSPGGQAFGATVTVVCSTGAFVDIAPSRTGQPWSPMHGGAYRYIFQASSGGDVLGTIDSYVGIGTTTSWRVVNAVNWDYFEMTTAW